MLEFVISDLKKAAVNFYTLTHIKIVLYDTDRKYLYSYPSDMCQYCDLIRSDPYLEKKCFKCDNIGFDVCDKTHKPYIYKCHMNLIEAIAPICENDVIIGYIMIGQMIGERDKFEARKKALKVATTYNLDKELLLKLFCSIRPVNKKIIDAAVNMMSMCACYLYCNKIVYNKTDILSYQLKEFIHSHYNENLSVPIICDQLFLSRSTLYNLSLSCFGMGISEYIKWYRINKAKDLLLSTNKPISVISEEVGFTDTNYFSRAFKQSQNVTPKQFKKLHAI